MPRVRKNGSKSSTLANLRQNQPLRSANTYAKIAIVIALMLVLAASADWLAPSALMRMWAPMIKGLKITNMSK
jgi:hypothetical protein